MRRLSSVCGVLGAAVILSSGIAAAESMRCDGGLVTVGDIKAEVLARCGEPEHKEGAEEGVEEGGVVERWTYNFGPHRFYHVVRFVEGRVVEIESPGYGH